MRIQPSLLAAAALFTIACSDHPAAPRPVERRMISSSVCPAASVVVHDEAELHAALDAAHAGDVIAVSGTIALEVRIQIRTSGVTLTCAAPGAGLSSVNPAPTLVRVLASDVTLTGLRLDGTGAASAVLAADSTMEQPLGRVRLIGNDIACGTDECVFFVGVHDAVVMENHVVSEGTDSGIHMQGAGEQLPGGSFPFGTDGSIIARNVLEAAVPSALGQFGAVRVRDGTGLRVAQNVITGPWRNGIAISEFFGGTVENNDAAGAERYGVLFSSNPFTSVSVRGSVFRNNRITAAGSGGILARLACDNQFRGNNLNGNGGDLGAVFEATTGNNVFIGNGNLVVDQGAMDCSGDGVPDPNRVTGSPIHAIAAPAAARRAGDDRVGPASLRGRAVPL